MAMLAQEQRKSECRPVGSDMPMAAQAPMFDVPGIGWSRTGLGVTTNPPINPLTDLHSWPPQPP